MQHLRKCGIYFGNSRKSIFKEPRKASGFKEAIQHPFGHGAVGRGSCFGNIRDFLTQHAWD